MATLIDSFRFKRNLPAAARSATTTGGAFEQPPVVVWQAANRLEAEVVKGRLISADIPAIVKAEALGAIYGMMVGGLAAAVVLVPQPLAEQAIKLLETNEDFSEE